MITYDNLTPEDAEMALALVMEFGERLADKDEWDMDDNFDTTEALYALYCEITGHDDTGHGDMEGLWWEV